MKNDLIQKPKEVKNKEELNLDVELSEGELETVAGGKSVVISNGVVKKDSLENISNMNSTNSILNKK